MKLKLFAAVALLGLSASTLSYAVSCEEDTSQMIDQINQYQSITTKDGYVIHKIYSPTQKTDMGCQAIAVGSKGLCNLWWTLGYWGDTIVCSNH